MLALADYSDDSGRSYPSVTKLAEKSRLSERSTQSALQELCESGELEIKPNAGPNGCNVYLIGVQKLRGAEIAGCRKQQNGVQKLREGGAEIAPKPSGTVIEPSGEGRVSLRWFPESLRDEAFKARFEEWETHLEVSKPLSPQARRAQLVECENNGRDTAMKALQFSIANNRSYIAWDWQRDSANRSKDRHQATRSGAVAPVHTDGPSDRL